jgi:predicted polyphosphate/ATP-dependent NAD kinase
MLLGVDAISEKRLLCADAGEAELLAAITGREASAILTPIGGHGHFCQSARKRGSRLEAN